MRPKRQQAEQNFTKSSFNCIHNTGVSNSFHRLFISSYFSSCFRLKVDCLFFSSRLFSAIRSRRAVLLGSFHSACERQTQTPQHRILRKAMPLAELLKSRVRDEFACPIMPWVPPCSCASGIPKQHSLDPPVRRQIRNMHRKLPAVAPSQVFQKFPTVHCSKSRTSTEENDQVLPDNRQVYRCYVYLANF